MPGAGRDERLASAFHQPCDALGPAAVTVDEQGVAQLRQIVAEGGLELAVEAVRVAFRSGRDQFGEGSGYGGEVGPAGGRDV